MSGTPPQPSPAATGSADMQAEIDRLTRELDKTSSEKIQSAQYGLVLLEEVLCTESPVTTAKILSFKSGLKSDIMSTNLNQYQNPHFLSLNTLNYFKVQRYSVARKRFCLTFTRNSFYKGQGDFLISMTLKISPNFEIDDP